MPLPLKVRKTFRDWNREETRRLAAEAPNPSEVRRERMDDMARYLYWDDYQAAAVRDNFEPEPQFAQALGT